MDKKTFLAFASVLLFSILLFVSSVEANHEKYNDSTLIVEVSTDRTVYKINETVTVHINVTNIGDCPMTLSFSSSYQFDYEIRDSYNSLVYRWSDDKVFLMVLTSVTVPAGESHVASFTHTPQDCSLNSGLYILAGIVVGYDVDNTVIEVAGEVVPEFPANIPDLSTAALAFGSEPRDSNWNPNVDLNQDGIINIVDIVTIVVLFGETCP